MEQNAKKDAISLSRFEGSIFSISTLLDTTKGLFCIITSEIIILYGDWREKFEPIAN
jgi:hypothetical protein